jgi:hypothetical protein
VAEAGTYFVGDGQWLVHNCSTQLGKALGSPPGSGFQAHHLIPESLQGHPFVSRAQGAGWNHDNAYNGLWLPNTKNTSPGNLPFHANHPQYSSVVRDELNALERRAVTEGWSNERARQELAMLAISLRGAIQTGGNSIPKLNDAFRR